MNDIDMNTNNGTTDGVGTVNVNNTSSNSNFVLRYIVV